MTYHLPEFAARLIRSLIPVVCPSDAPRNASIDEVTREVERTLGSMPVPVRTALLSGIAGYDAVAAVHPRNRLRRAHRLTGGAARDYFESWWNSRNPLQREFANAIKGFICMAYYETPGVKADLGYTPDNWIGKVRRRRLSVHSPAIEAHEQALRAPDPLPRGHFEVALR